MALFTYLALACIIIIGLGLGATTTIADFQSALKKPAAVGIGFLSQYLFMPVAAYLLCVIFNVNTNIAIGTVLVGCSPGGTTSNIFTYWTSGDVALSITMSFLSTAAAFFMMPLWVLLLVRLAFGSDVDFAWSNIVLSLILILIPTLMGLALRHHNTEMKIGGRFVWQWVELATTVFGVLFLFAALISALITHHEDLARMPASVWVMGVILQPLGCAFGFFAAKYVHLVPGCAALTSVGNDGSKTTASTGTNAVDAATTPGLPPKIQRTVSLETGVQNVTLTFAIINLTFNEPELTDVMMFPLVYGLLYFVNSLLIVSYYRWWLAPLDADVTVAWEEKKAEVADVEGGAVVLHGSTGGDYAPAPVVDDKAAEVEMRAAGTV